VVQRHPKRRQCQQPLSATCCPVPVGCVSAGGRRCAHWRPDDANSSVTAVVNLLITGQVEGVKAQVSGGVSPTCHHFIGRIFKAWRAPAMRVVGTTLI